MSISRQRRWLRLLVAVWLLGAGASAGQAQTNAPMERIRTLPTEAPFPAGSWLTTEASQGAFPLVQGGKPCGLLVSETDHPGVKKVAGWLQRDLSRVSGTPAKLVVGASHPAPNLIVAGTLGQSALIDGLVAAGKIDPGELEGKWEQFLWLTVRKPLPGVEHALVIVGSDKRGTLFGLLELSQAMGVSPWYWWADVPVKQRKNIFVKPGRHSQGEPQVKYRGIFINDEAPALSGWVEEKYGDFNHAFYEKVYELILRLKGNYLWPAMWGRSLWDDDSLSAPLADELGVVLATSHHEPLMRAHVEWARYGEGPWNYEQNAGRLREFWREGMERSQGYESVVTLAMRGDGDEAMSDDTNIGLLEKIVADQREIIAEVTGKPAAATPQVWALYKEVQAYYDQGMRVPEDVTLLLCDDNWGHVRILPDPQAEARAGGYGMYYHFDFVGGPRSYKWLNTVQIERVWEQMNLTYAYGVDEIWLVNVGDIKPMEFPISFFLDYAWNPEAISAEDLPAYYPRWASEQFGPEQAEAIGDLIAQYTKYNARRKPELLSPDTYSLEHFREAERVGEAYAALAEEARRIGQAQPEAAFAAYYQLVQYPIEACANLNQLYLAAAKNQRYAQQGRASTNLYAEQVKARFFQDAALTRYFHDSLANGKWNHTMAQTHIGYTSWRDPRFNQMPAVTYLQPAPVAQLGYELEAGGQQRGRNEAPSLPPFDPVNDQRYYVEVFNQGGQPLSYRLAARQDWIELSKTGGEIQYEEKVYVSIDWERVPAGTTTGEIELSGAGESHAVAVRLRPFEGETKGFVSNQGIVSIPAADYQQAQTARDISWEVIPNLGRTGDGITALPVTVQGSGEAAVSLSYDFFLLDSGRYELVAYFSPTLNFQQDEGLRYAFSVDNDEPVLANLHAEATAPDWTYPQWWNEAVTNNIMQQTVLETDLAAGAHRLTYRLVDPGLVLQKIVLRQKGREDQSYLGPPPSVRR